VQRNLLFDRDFGMENLNSWQHCGVEEYSAWKLLMVVLSERCKCDPSLCTISDTIIRFRSLACCQDLLALTQNFVMKVSHSL
jgi:hypothetical protein